MEWNSTNHYVGSSRRTSTSYEAKIDGGDGVKTHRQGVSKRVLDVTGTDMCHACTKRDQLAGHSQAINAMEDVTRLKVGRYDAAELRTPALHFPGNTETPAAASGRHTSSVPTSTG